MNLKRLSDNSYEYKGKTVKLVNDRLGMWTVWVDDKQLFNGHIAYRAMYPDPLKRIAKIHIDREH